MFPGEEVRAVTKYVGKDYSQVVFTTSHKHGHSVVFGVLACEDVYVALSEVVGKTFL